MSEPIRRVSICEHTKKEVVQELDRGEWLCLHNDNIYQDEIDVIKFKQGELK